MPVGLVSNFSDDSIQIDSVPGLSISGGVDSKTQPEIRIESVFPGGAADIEGTLKVRHMELPGYIQQSPSNRHTPSDK